MHRCCAVLPATVFVLLAPALAIPASAQSEPEYVGVVGLVVDGLRGTPLPGVLVRADHDRGILTDENGRFVLRDLTVGTHLFSIRQYGYQDRLITRVLSAGDAEPWIVPLQPSPAALEGFEVVADNLATIERRLRQRRNAAPVSVRTVDQERLLASMASDLLGVLTTEASVRPIPCSGSSSALRPVNGWCIWRRGEMEYVEVYIDEAPLIGGNDALQDYHPLDIYLIEVYENGRQVRLYTHRFMERMALRPMPLHRVW